jgi:hypothetical protein
MRNCKAKQFSDQMVCTECVLVWDMNDPAPPRCKMTEEEQVPSRAQSRPKSRDVGNVKPSASSLTPEKSLEKMHAIEAHTGKPTEPKWMSDHSTRVRIINKWNEVCFKSFKGRKVV